MSSLSEFWNIAHLPMILQQVIIVVVLSFVASRIANVLSFAMNPSNILWGARRLVLKVFSDFEADSYLHIDERIEKAEEESLVAHLLGCVYCLSVWMGIFIMIPLFDGTLGGALSALTIPFISFFMTDKI